MPAMSESQRRFLYATKGKAWVEAHHFDNKGKLPEKIGANDSRMMEGSFSRPLNGGGRNKKLTLGQMQERGQAMVDAINESHYLVNKKVNGKMEHHLPVGDAKHMGMAWAALHGGFRGNKYEGGDKAEAISKLKALYKKRGLEVPNEDYDGE